MTSSVTRAAFVAEAREWIGTKFAHQHRSRSGCDCSGLLIGVGRALGIVDRDFNIAGYSEDFRSAFLIEQCGRWLRRIDPSAATAGDVGIFLIGKEPRHIAIFGDYLHGGLSMIHSIADGPARVVEHHFSPLWRQRLVAAYSIPGVE